MITGKTTRIDVFEKFTCEALCELHFVNVTKVCFVIPGLRDKKREKKREKDRKIFHDHDTLLSCRGTLTRNAPAR